MARKSDLAETKVQSYRDAKLACMRASISQHSNVGSLRDAGDTVAINEIADATQKREVQVMSPDEYKGWYRNYKK